MPMKHPITPRGLEKLKVELKSLKSERPAAAHAIELARAHGDISENADYDAAKERSGMLEAKIRDLEGRISNAQIIDPSKLINPEKVVFGVSVKLFEVESGEEKVLSIYGSAESDMTKGWISFETPMARALIGKRAGDIAELRLPGGNKSYEILEIFVDY